MKIDRRSLLAGGLGTLAFGAAPAFSWDQGFDTSTAGLVGGPGRLCPPRAPAPPPVFTQRWGVTCR